MQINLLDFKLAEKQTKRHILKTSIILSLIVLMVVSFFYLLYLRAVEEKSNAEQNYEQLKIKQLQLNSNLLNDDRQNVIRRNILTEYDASKSSVVSPLNSICLVTGNDVNIAKITIKGKETIIEASAENSGQIKRYIQALNECGYFETVKELRIENNPDGKGIEFYLKLSRRD